MIKAKLISAARINLTLLTKKKKKSSYQYYYYGINIFFQYWYQSLSVEIKAGFTGKMFGK